jgi:hypothetical protein
MAHPNYTITATKSKPHNGFVTLVVTAEATVRLGTTLTITPLPSNGPKTIELLELTDEFTHHALDPQTEILVKVSRTHVVTAEVETIRIFFRSSIIDLNPADAQDVPVTTR